MILGIVASGQMAAAAGPPPIDITEPWGEVARQESIVGGKLTVSGLNLSGLIMVRLIISGITVTTDDSDVQLRFIVGGSEVSSGYQWGQSNSTATAQAFSASDSEIHLTTGIASEGVGNAATEHFHAVVTVPNPSGTHHKLAHYWASWIRPDGVIRSTLYAGGALHNSGAITGFVVMGSSDLTAGTVVVLGVE